MTQSFVDTIHAKKIVSYDPKEKKKRRKLLYNLEVVNYITHWAVGDEKGLNSQH